MIIKDVHPILYQMLSQLWLIFFQQFADNVRIDAYLRQRRCKVAIQVAVNGRYKQPKCILKGGGKKLC